MKSIAFFLLPFLNIPSATAFVLETRRNVALNTRTAPSPLFSSFTSPDWMIPPPIVDDSTEYEDLVSDRIEKEDKPDGTVAMLSAATGVLLSLVLIMAAMGGNDSSTAVSSAPAAVREESVPKQERVYQAPEVQDEGSYDFLIDQSAGFFFY
mmetsp:Transcript_13900/g.26655  ORF Transcript_13900/g.26655 Transcript_13900/m.26655 type:complete len:152 (-) Transcript_13900:123-578(-)